MKTLLFAFTGVITFLLVTQLLHARHYGDRATLQNTDITSEEVEYTPPQSGLPEITLPSGTR